jgi:hypothetical protein
MRSTASSSLTFVGLDDIEAQLAGAASADRRRGELRPAPAGASGRVTTEGRAVRRGASGRRIAAAKSDVPR